MLGFIEYSPFMLVDRNFGVPTSPNSSIEDTKLKDDESLVKLNYVSLAATCRTVITALKEELGKA